MATVRKFGALYEVRGNFVYSKDDTVKVTPMNAQRFVTAFGESFPGTAYFPSKVYLKKDEKTLMTCAAQLAEQWKGDELLQIG